MKEVLIFLGKVLISLMEWIAFIAILFLCFVMMFVVKN